MAHIGCVRSRTRLAQSHDALSLCLSLTVEEQHAHFTVFCRILIENRVASGGMIPLDNGTRGFLRAADGHVSQHMMCMHTYIAIGRRLIGMNIRYTTFLCSSQIRRSKPEIRQMAISIGQATFMPSEERKEAELAGFRFARMMHRAHAVEQVLFTTK